MRTTQTTEARVSSAIVALFNGLPRTARFYVFLSALVLVLVVASGLAVEDAVEATLLDLNPRTPMLSHLSPWGRVVSSTPGGFLRSGFDVLGMPTPVPSDAMSYDYVAEPGEDLESIAVAHGIDLDLRARANAHV